MKVDWLHLKRLLGINPSTPLATQEGQVRYVRDGAVDGKLYFARRLSGGTYEWREVDVDTPTFTSVTTGDLTATGTTALGNQSVDTTTIQGRIITAGGDPGIAVNAVDATGAGVGASASISGDNQCGIVTIDPAGSPGAGTQATITFSNSVDRGSTNYVVILLPREADALTDMTKVRATPSSGTQWELIANAALNTNEHIWNYLVIEYG